jgi:diguanylate cyclase (GGDEF)-like protein/hemerythrin-like metal-binding protein
VAGILVALALLAILAYRPLRDRVLSMAGLFGLTVAAAWITFSDIAPSLLPGPLIPAIRPLSVVLAGASLAAWERVTTYLLATSPGARHLAHLRRFTAISALAISLVALVPWEPSFRMSRLILGLLASLLAILTLTAGLRAHRDRVGGARLVVAVSLALLLRCASLAATSMGWMSRAASLTTIQLALLALALALGWTMLSRMKELRKTSEAAQAAQLAVASGQTHDLEDLVQERNAELSERLRDLGEARQTAEAANQGLQRALTQLEQVASTDRLTGAWNRRRFEEAVLPEIALAKRRREPLSLLMFDLDHFKRVNDTFGHGSGDVVLAATAQAVRQHLRISDALIRWGGEEFLVMTPATRLEGAMDLAEKLRAAMAAIDFPDAGQVTMSLGVSEYAPGESLEAWIERTDRALYRAKAEGRNRVVSASPPEYPGAESSPEQSLLEMVWEDSYASGHPLIDTQHQRLFQLASTLMAVVTEHRPLAEVSLRLETLLAHTAQHFHDEEALLREAHYPHLKVHAEAHASLLQQAGKLQAEVQAGQLDFGRLVTFLALDLVKGHILTEDRGHFPHLLTLTEPDGKPAIGA